MNIYGTFANQNFLPQLLALITSFHEKTKVSRLAIFALDDQTHKVIEELGFDRVDLLRLQDLEVFHPELLIAKSNRTQSEYFFTLTSAIPSFLMGNYPSCNFAVYLDADLFLFADPDFILDSAESKINVVLTPHNFAKKDLNLLIYGEFNTGYIAFRNNSPSADAAKWWLQSCLNWCRDKVEDGKYADQKYLENFSAIIDGVMNCNEFGLNLGPWGLNNVTTISNNAREWKVNNQKLYAFHFSGVKWNRWGVILGAWPYKHRINITLYNGVYRPYLCEIIKWDRYISTQVTPTSVRKSLKSLRSTRKVTLSVIFRAVLTNDIRSWRGVTYDSNK
jgi:hypothetical protein